MPRYRYRTRALVGPWRKKHEEALLDAIGAHQVLLEESTPLKFRWLVPGEIEEEGAAEEAPAAGAGGA